LIERYSLLPFLPVTLRDFRVLGQMLDVRLDMLIQ